MKKTTEIINESSKIIAPLWPLKSFVAVNPFWNVKEKIFHNALCQLGSLSGQSLFMPLNYYINEYENKKINDEDILKSMDLSSDIGIMFPRNCSQFLEESRTCDESQLNYKTYSELLSDFLNIRAKEHIVEEISKYCASYFNVEKSSIGLNCTYKRLYLQWRDLIKSDRSFEFLGYGSSELFASLPEDPSNLIEQCLQILGVVEELDLKLYLMKICHHMLGWCSHVSFQLWQQNLHLPSDARGTKIEDVIALFLYYECLQKMAKQEASAMWSEFYSSQSNTFRKYENTLRQKETLQVIWQRACEWSYQKKVVKQITQFGFQNKEQNDISKVQMVFCIDVRSETIRRKIESTLPIVSTHGFAGFFGVTLKREQDNEASYHCPVLISPKIDVTELPNYKNKRKNSLKGFLIKFKQGFLSSFIFVELWGILSIFNILKKTFPLQFLYRNKKMNLLFKVASHQNNMTEENQFSTAINFLTHLGVREYSDTVIICGHGSITTNNAFASSLQCGACGGHSGHYNAEFICSLLNNKNIRNRIQQDGKFKLRDTTHFIPAVHETVSDEIIFLNDDLSKKNLTLFSELQVGFYRASKEAQQEKQGLSNINSSNAFERSSFWGEVRPDWALAKNAAFFVAPRKRTKDISLQGRAFLHNYEMSNDADKKTLELILTAPMVVTNWINMQYYASSVCPEIYGAGNKVLHNIEGRFGVVEGNGGDLKIGLPFQSVHDGTQLVHEPLRLSVFIEARSEDVEKIIESHDNVRHLVDNQWLHIFLINEEKQNILYRRSTSQYEVVN